MAVNHQSVFLSLLQGLQHSDPRLYDALKLFGTDFYALLNEIHPPSSSTNSTGSGSVTPEITGFTATLFNNNLRLTWNPSSGLVSYEIRYQASSSTDWDTASSLLRTSTNSADIDPLVIPLVYGTYTFLIRVTDSLGIENPTTSNVTINIPLIGVPIITPTVIDNNVLLSWTQPSSVFLINNYNLYRNNIFPGTVHGNFAPRFETSAGTYEYAIEAVDIVGNIGTRGTVSALVNQPPDYELRDVRISDFSGTKVNTYVENGLLLACVNITETYQQHFDNNGWDGP